MRVKLKMQWRPQKVTDDRNEECLLKKSFREWADLKERPCWRHLKVIKAAELTLCHLMPSMPDDHRNWHFTFRGLALLSTHLPLLFSYSSLLEQDCFILCYCILEMYNLTFDFTRVYNEECILSLKGDLELGLLNSVESLSSDSW